MTDNAASDESDRRSREYKDMMAKAAKESSRGFVITTAAVIDFYLERVLKAFLIDGQEVRELFEGAYAPFGDMSGKTKSAYVLGLITKKESDQINAIRKVRNLFAHEIDASFEHERVQILCRRSPLSAAQGDELKVFANVAIEVGVGLIHRDIEIAKDHKRKVREEPKPTFLFT